MLMFGDQEGMLLENDVIQFEGLREHEIRVHKSWALGKAAPPLDSKLSP